MFLFTCLSKSTFVTCGLFVLTSGFFIFIFYWEKIFIVSAVSTTSSQFEFSVGEEFTLKETDLN